MAQLHSECPGRVPAATHGGTEMFLAAGSRHEPVSVSVVTIGIATEASPPAVTRVEASELHGRAEEPILRVHAADHHDRRMQRERRQPADLGAAQAAVDEVHPDEPLIPVDDLAEQAVVFLSGSITRRPLPVERSEPRSFSVARPSFLRVSVPATRLRGALGLHQ
jgi:hypothetical protein